MAGFFDDMAEMVRDLLQPDDDGGLGAAAGSIALVVEKPGTKDPDKPWIDHEPMVERQTLRAHAFGVPQSMIDGETVMAGDQYVISEVPSIEWTVPAGEAGRNTVIKIEIDGVAWQVVRTVDIPAAGTRSAVKFFIRN